MNALMPHLSWLNFSVSLDFSLQETKQKQTCLTLGYIILSILAFIFYSAYCVNPLTTRFLAVSGFHLDRMMHLKFEKDGKKGEKKGVVTKAPVGNVTV